ncbi:DUF3820 family protein [Planctomicrobium piriforme]|uniref:Putative quorum-sensing-regulated virulence factor n=1 Tax=Planctomicrobium piriforme TaxID=1576369 RepID=A0A1I3EAU4_9PLAN|nr:DUF3820 family protein [Planctomicrobium piriforme]SFH96038.1 Putative quorum-sensing-regulated virulence factor [Planctomicrobium piriforme]
MIRKLNFGKHRGLRITDVPDSYLRWMVETLSDVSMVQAAKIALDARQTAAAGHVESAYKFYVARQKHLKAKLKAERSKTAKKTRRNRKPAPKPEDVVLAETHFPYKMPNGEMTWIPRDAMLGEFDGEECPFEVDDSLDREFSSMFSPWGPLGQ